ncbi:hypothetical protein [Sinimarinibacterium thermocellulolyticum]|uniref:PD-(D/E)XK endonuclease-like domain-containing protein n=1 Tax=Sinimarinibacterium thermocellulolyticum TaxID=3170016 RepID=A0ABV2ADE9_9GAMM
MSVSVHAEIDECPRRWALSAAAYPELWSGRGYPQKLQLATLAGSVVHLALEVITKQLTQAGVPSLNHPLATQVLKELGGYTRVVEECVERILRRFDDNPRALPIVEQARRMLRGQVPTLRARVQSMLARLRLPKAALAARPPEARPATETCRYCGVRQLCDAYWAGAAQAISEDGCFGDIELKITGRHGPTNWDAVVARAHILPAKTPALLRLQQADEFTTGTLVRVLDGALARDPEDDSAPAIITLSARSEAYRVE